MGDFLTLANHLDLSPLNTVLLGVLYLFLRNIFDRIKKLEATSIRNRTSIAIVKHHLSIEEDGD